jgi:predicted RNase H-like HicB family nuclease
MTIRKYPVILINNNGYWFVDCKKFGIIDLGDDVTEAMKLMEELEG